MIGYKYELLSIAKKFDQKLTTSLRGGVDKPPTFLETIRKTIYHLVTLL